MINRAVIILFSFLIFSAAFPQSSDTTNKRAISSKGNAVHSLAFKPFLGFDYTFAYQKSRYFGFGFSIRYGVSASIIVTHPAFEAHRSYYIHIINGYSVFKSSSWTKMYLPLLGYSIFYRIYPAQNVYFDTGIIGSIGYSSFSDEHINDFTRVVGGYLSINYGFKKVKFGHEIQIAVMDIEFYKNSERGKPTILFNPLIIRFEL